MAKTYKGEGFEDSAIVCLARVVGGDGSAVTQATVTAISRTIWDLGAEKTSNTQVGTAEAVTIATSIYDQLQTDAAWSVDATGYNFRDVVPDTKFATGGHWYRIEYAFTLTDGTKFVQPYEYLANEVHST